MKKVFAVLFALLIMLCAVCIPVYAEEDEIFSEETLEYYKNLGLQGTVLNVYNWGEYISDGSEGSFDTVREFETWYQETYGQKVTVNYSTFASNEDMYSKISSGAVSYDVIIPS
ncbi:MAG: spermidine/putrescine ABC transporter substrate-binding protein, partial [Candidatus Fimenecus sp.]